MPVRIKSVEQQALQRLHRVRSAWMATRTARINALHGFCREFGIGIAEGSRVGAEQIARVLADPTSAIPVLLREPMRLKPPAPSPMSSHASASPRCATGRPMAQHPGQRNSGARRFQCRPEPPP